MTYVFDLDGTLIDSSKRHYLLMEELLRVRGLNVPEEFRISFLDYKRSGRSGKGYLKDVLKLDVELSNSINKEWIDYIEDDRWLEYDSLYEDSIEMLVTIKERGSSIVYLTMRNKDEGAEKEIERLGLIQYPDHILILSHNDNKADYLRKIHGDFIMVGDTEVDYQAALETKADTYILSRGFRSREYWNRLGVTSHCSFKDLLNRTKQ